MGYLEEDMSFVFLMQINSNNKENVSNGPRNCCCFFFSQIDSKCAVHAPGITSLNENYWNYEFINACRGGRGELYSLTVPMVMLNK